MYIGIQAQKQKQKITMYNLPLIMANGTAQATKTKKIH